MKDTFIHETTSISCNDIGVQIIADTDSSETSPDTEYSMPADSLEDTWKIEIPSLNLEAPIREGTSQNVLYDSVGHFENTNLFDGNVGLAAHNRRISNKLFC